MAEEYIKRESVIEAIENDCSELVYYTKEEAIRCVKAVPAADVVEVRHGRWIQPHWKNSNYCCNCSECGREAMHADYQWDKNGIYSICPNCGAIMDKEGYENH